MTKIYSAKDPECVNLRIVETETGNELFFPSALFANEDTQECYVETRDSYSTTPRLGKLGAKFKIVNTLTGTHGKPSISNLFSTEEKVLVIAGGPSIKSDLAMLDLSSFGKIISINHHGAEVTDVDIVVANDTHTLRNSIITDSHIIISQWGHISDYVINGREFHPWWQHSSQALALWLAGHMANTVVLAGFEMYAMSDKELHDVLVFQWSVAKKYLNQSTKILVCSGPLQEIFNPIEEVM
jgi:hypothetical protein